MSGRAASRSELLFGRSFGCEAAALGSAPGRVNLIGEHTDYNDGFVLPMAIEQRTGVAVGPSNDGVWRFISELDGREITLRDEGAMDAERRDWTSYCRGVVAGFRAAGYEVPALRVAVASDVPTGGGLSSSAALEVATASALEGLLGVRLDPVDKALLCQHAEHEFAGVPCGYMDQAISVMGQADHALLIDCRSRVTLPVQVSDGSVSILIVNSMVRHELSGGEYAKRRAECALAVRGLQADFPAIKSLRDATMEQLESAGPEMTEVIRRRARHVISEISRTVQAADALERRQYERVGRLMQQSHLSLRDDYEVSCDELDLLVKLVARQRGVHGARMTGGGFGGCIVALVESLRADEVGGGIAVAYEQSTGLQPQWFVTGAGEGARVEQCVEPR